MDIIDILIYAVNILIFPGLLFTCLFGLWLAGIDRKVVARMQKRKGPPITQPAWDFLKLMGKECIVPDTAARTTFLAAPWLGLASLVVTVLFIPIGGYQAFGVNGQDRRQNRNDDYRQPDRLKRGPGFHKPYSCRYEHDRHNLYQKSRRLPDLSDL